MFLDTLIVEAQEDEGTLLPPSQPFLSTGDMRSFHSEPSFQQMDAYRTDQLARFLGGSTQTTDSADTFSFHPFFPDIVKHRKRTSASQLRILEHVFRTTTKPNAHLRKELGEQLQMTPRAVQVCFPDRSAQ